MSIDRRALLGAGLAATWAGAARGNAGVELQLCEITLVSKGSPGSIRPAPLVEALEAKLRARARGETVDERFAERSDERLQEIVEALRPSRHCVLVAVDIPSLRAIARTLPDKPLLFQVHADPVRHGLVDSLARTGRHYSGISTFLETIDAKMIELAIDAFPSGRVVGYVFDSREGPTDEDVPGMAKVASRVGRRLVALDHRRWTDGSTLRRLVREQHIDIAVVGANSSTWPLRETIAEVFAGLRIPAVYESPMFVRTWSPLSFGTSRSEAAARLAEMVVRVLDGEPAGSLPVLRPTRFELVVNLPALQRQQLQVAQTVLRRASRVLREP